MQFTTHLTGYYVWQMYGNRRTSRYTIHISTSYTGVGICDKLNNLQRLIMGYLCTYIIHELEESIDMVSNIVVPAAPIPAGTDSRKAASPSGRTNKQENESRYMVGCDVPLLLHRQAAF